MSADRKNFQYEISGCEMFFSRADWPNNLTQPRNIQKLDSNTYVEQEDRNVNVGIPLIDDHRMIVRHTKIGKFPIIIGMVDEQDEASNYPNTSSHKIITTRVLVTPDTYLNIQFSDLRKPHSPTSISVITASPFAVNHVADSTIPYYDSIIKPANQRVAIQMGRMFVPGTAEAGNAIYHPRTGKPHVIQENCKYFHHSNELTVNNYGNQEFRLPRRSFSTSIRLPNGNRITDKDVTNLSYTKFGNGIRQSFKWIDNTGYILVNDFESDLTIEADSRLVQVTRDNGLCLVLPLVCQRQQIPLEADDKLEEFLNKYEIFIQDKILPQISVSSDGKVLDLMGFSND